MISKFCIKLSYLFFVEAIRKRTLLNFENMHKTTALFEFLSGKCLNKITLPDLKTTAIDLCSVYNMHLDCLQFQNELE